MNTVRNTEVLQFKQFGGGGGVGLPEKNFAPSQGQRGIVVSYYQLI